MRGKSCRRCRPERWKGRNSSLDVLSMRCLPEVHGVGGGEGEIKSVDEHIELDSRGEWSWRWKSWCCQ